MNIPTRTEFKRALAAIEALERELAVQRAAVEGLAAKALGRGRRRPASGAPAKAARPRRQG